ncbi:MAG: methionine--tRNA ligase [Dehalococcoidia bacterium]|nr:methionine--tRNA ligase [Dehalococcoidia bacterium]
MSERIFIGVAWPYANGPLHVGQIAGAFLPPDIFARFHRLKGNEVLMVSGSDQHGTPITVRAEQEGKTPAQVAAHFHGLFMDMWKSLGITFDLYTSTGTQNHSEVVHDVFLTLLNNGYIYPATMNSPFCPTCRRFLPDRYVEGQCPNCGHLGARGDQCDNCGKPLDATELVNPRCKFDGSTPVIRETEHFFLRLTAFNQDLLEWVDKQSHWRSNVKNFTARYLSEGLKDRPITRDIEWGVSVPVAGFESKRIYVWFEAVIGYLSASKEWAAKVGEPEKWREFWQETCKSYYFIGKDNIPFHTMIWPAMLMGYGGLNLPYDIPANEYMTIQGQKISTSRNWAVWLHDVLDGYDPDALRYVLSAAAPETSDSDFSWSEFVRRNNDELVATYGNLVHRVLTFTYRNYDHKVPTPGAYEEGDDAMLARAKSTMQSVDKLLSGCHFREALREAMGLAQEANRYLEENSPWKTIKTDRQRAGTSLYVAIAVINSLKTILFPYIPFSSERLQQSLGFVTTIEEDGWNISVVPPGQELGQPSPLFVKLDENIVESETRKLGHS